MSAIDHRQRIRDRKAKEKAFHSGAFSPQETVTTMAPAPTTQVQEPTRRQEQPIDTDPTANAVVPQGERQRMTPVELRNHGKQLAETLAQLDQEQYDSALNNLEKTNPTLYGVVCDELNNLAAQDNEGDGYDLTNVANQ